MPSFIKIGEGRDNLCTFLIDLKWNDPYLFKADVENDRLVLQDGAVTSFTHLDSSCGMSDII